MSGHSLAVGKVQTSVQDTVSSCGPHPWPNFYLCPLAHIFPADTVEATYIYGTGHAFCQCRIGGLDTSGYSEDESTPDGLVSSIVIKEMEHPPDYHCYYEFRMGIFAGDSIDDVEIFSGGGWPDLTFRLDRLHNICPSELWTRPIYYTITQYHSTDIRPALEFLSRGNIVEITRIREMLITPQTPWAG